MWIILADDISHHQEFEKNYNLYVMVDLSHGKETDYVIVSQKKHLKSLEIYPKWGKDLYYKCILPNWKVKFRIWLGQLHFKILSIMPGVTIYKFGKRELKFLNAHLDLFNDLQKEKREYMELYIQENIEFSGRAYLGPHDFQFAENVKNEINEKSQREHIAYGWEKYTIKHEKVPGGWMLFFT